MFDADLATLAALIRRDIKPILERWRQAVRELPSARHLDVPTLNDHLPLLLEELADANGIRLQPKAVRILNRVLQTTYSCSPMPASCDGCSRT